MERDERSLRAGRLREIVDGRDPGDWIDDQIADIRAKQEAHAAA
jgi:trehalose 6-phosphate synthase